MDRMSQEELDRLEAQWNSERPGRDDGLNLADLRFLLERFAPLQALIRETATGTAAPASAASLQQDNDRLRQSCSDLENRLRSVEAELQLRDSELARQADAPAAVTFLRSEDELARQLGLDGLPADNLEALTRIVAVLAQQENLERLWHALKDRCETHERSASDAEQALLDSALGWYNHNWRTRPWRLASARIGASYDYEQHLRSRNTASGETLASLYLPGIVDGSGRTVCKTLVTTH